MISEIVPIQKELISNEKFPRKEVLETSDEIRNRKALLSKATLLGNAYHHKVKIIFETLSETRLVETTIWATDEFMISLKGGVTIPIQSIYEVVI